MTSEGDDKNLEEEAAAVVDAGLGEFTSVDTANLPTPDFLALLGGLIDRAADLGCREGLRLAINWADAIEKRELTQGQAMTLEYFRGNTWLDLYALARHSGKRDDHSWTQPELEKAVLALRKVLANKAFTGWSRVRQAQLYTNLGNALSTLGRPLDAIASRDRALEVAPNFGMALGTRAETIDACRGILFRRQDGLAYLAAAAKGFGAATAPEAYYENDSYGAIREKWASKRDELEKWLVENEVEPDVIVLDESSPEGAFRRWSWEKRLVLNPLNDIGLYVRDHFDTLHLPPIAPHDGIAELLFGCMDSMKQEYCSARWSLFEATNVTGMPHYSDKGLGHHDTGDKPLYGLSTERMKGAYRVAYSLFDKVALFVNVYFGVKLPARQVTFSSIWRSRQGEVRPMFAASRNWPLRGLYWIARDLAEPGFRDVTEPDAQALADLRNYTEHRFVRVVGAPGPAETNAGDVLLTVSRDDFERRTITILRLARAALVMLVSAVFVEERRRGPGRGSPTALRRL